MTVPQAFAAVIAISALSGSTAVPAASAAAELPAPAPVVEPAPVAVPVEAPVVGSPPVGDAAPVDPPAAPLPPADPEPPNLAPPPPDPVALGDERPSAPPEVRGVEAITEVAAQGPPPGAPSASPSPPPSPPPPFVSPPRAVPPPRAMHAQSPDADSPSVSDCTARPDGNACEQLGAVCNLREGGTACGQLRSRCDSEVSAPGQTDIDQCRAYERAAFCLERPLSSSCDAVVREPCARDGGSTPDDSPLCRLQEAVRKARAAERNRQQHGEHGGETPAPAVPGGGGGDGGSGGVVTDAGGPAPVAAGALLVQLHEQLAAESPPDPVTLALARVKLVRRGVQVALLCDAAGQGGRLELRARAGRALIGKARFRCDEAGTMTVVVAVKRATRQDLTDGTSLLAKIVQPTSAGERSSSSERVSIDTGG